MGASVWCLGHCLAHRRQSLSVTNVTRDHEATGKEPQPPEGKGNSHLSVLFSKMGQMPAEAGPRDLTGRASPAVGWCLSEDRGPGRPQRWLTLEESPFSNTQPQLPARQLQEPEGLALLTGVWKPQPGPVGTTPQPKGTGQGGPGAGTPLEHTHVYLPRPPGTRRLTSRSWPHAEPQAALLRAMGSPYAPPESQSHLLHPPAPALPDKPGLLSQSGWIPCLRESCCAGEAPTPSLSPAHRSAPLQTAWTQACAPEEHCSCSRNSPPCPRPERGAPTPTRPQSLSSSHQVSSPRSGGDRQPGLCPVVLVCHLGPAFLEPDSALVIWGLGSAAPSPARPPPWPGSGTPKTTGAPLSGPTDPG